MRVGNGSKVDVIAVGMLPLHLPSGLVLDLNNCYLVPVLSMNIISGSCLMRDGYSFKSENKGCSIYMSNIFYGHAPLKSGLFVLNLALLGKGLLVAHQFCLLMAHYWCATSTTPLVFFY